jgi:hypothetical protein
MRTPASLYLQGVQTGTRKYLYGMSVKGWKGMAAHWPNMTSEGSRAEALRTHHAGGSSSSNIRCSTFRCAWPPRRSWSCRRRCGPAAARRTCANCYIFSWKEKRAAHRMLSMVLSLIMHLYLQRIQ